LLNVVLHDQKFEHNAALLSNDNEQRIKRKVAPKKSRVGTPRPSS
jgi:CRP/FNR family cyclic AMP-dependent transcriptional regulator